MSYQTKSPMLHAVIQYSRVDYRFSQVTNTVRYARTVLALLAQKLNILVRDAVERLSARASVCLCVGRLRSLSCL